MATLNRFEVVVERHHDEIYRYVWRMLAGDSAERAVLAEDVTQDVFVRAYGAYARLRPGSNVRAWLYRIATNRALTVLKQRGREAGRLEPLDEELVPGSDARRGPESNLTRQETHDDLRMALETLPPQQRAAVILRYLDELPYADVSEALACSEASARANVYQGLRRLRLVMVKSEVVE